MDEFKILLKTIVDAKDTQTQLNAIKDLSVKITKLNLDQSTITELKNQLSKNGIDVNLVFGNTSQIQNQAKQTGQQIGKLVSDSAEKAISGTSSKGIGRYFRVDPSTSKEFEDEMKNLVSQWTNAKGEMTDLKIDTRTVYDKDADASFERLHQATVTYKNDLDEVTKKTIAWRQVGTTTDTKGNEVAIRGFVEVAGQYSKALERASIAADTFADKQTRLKSSLSDSLNSIKSSVADQNVSKPIKDQTNISSLQSQYQIVEQAISNVGSASKSNFTQMEADARTQISVLNDMVRQYRNAENVATSLRTKDFSTVKDVQVQNLQAFKDKIEGSNVPITKMQTELSNLDAALNNAFDAESLTSYLNQMDVVQAKFKQMSTEITSANRNEKVGINVSGLESKITDIQRISPEINNFKTQINGAEISVESLLKDLSNINSQGDFSVANAKFKAFTDSAKAAGIAITELVTNSKKIDKIQLSINNGHGVSEYQNRIRELINDFQRYGVSAKNAETATTQLQTTFNNMKNMSGQELVNQADKFEREFKAVKVSIDQAKLAYDKFTQPVSQEKVSSLIIKINNFINKNSKITDEARKKLEQYAQMLSLGNVSLAKYNEINLALKETDSNMRKLGRLGKSLKDQLSQAATSFTQWISVSSIIMSLVYQLKKIPKAVYEIDTAMTNLYKVTDTTSAKYNTFLDDSNKKAKELGRSVSSLIEQSASWAKLGFNIDESAKLAEYSSIYSNVGEVDDSTAVSDMVTSMKAFNITAKDSIKIVDSLNKLGNEFATDAKSLGEGLSNSASAMALGGMSLEKTLALLTGGSEITQEAGELGNALKVGQMRVMGMKGALEELGEEFDDIESVSKMQTRILNLTKGQVNIMNDADPTKFKDYYDILEGISKIYGDLAQTEQADLLETLFGKLRGNQGAALIQAFQSGQIQKAYQAANNSEGSAIQEQERWLESAEAKTKQFEASFQSLSQTILDSDLLKFFIDLGIEGTTSLEKLIKTFGILGTVSATTFAAIAGRSNKGFTNLVQKGNGSGQSLNLSLFGLNDIHKALNAVNKEVSANNGSGAILALQKHCKNLSLEQKKLVLQSVRTGQSLKTLSANMIKASISAKAASVGMTALNIAMNVGIMLAISAAIQGIVWIFDKLIVTQKEAIDTSAEFASQLDTLKSDIDELNTKLSETSESIRNLQSNGNLSFIEQEELSKLKQTNEELERELKLKQNLLDIATREASDAAADVLSAKSYVSNEKIDARVVNKITPIDYAKEQMVIISSYDESIRQAQIAQTKLGEITSKNKDEFDKLQDRIDKYKLKQDEANDKLTETIDLINTQNKTLLDSDPLKASVESLLQSYSKMSDTSQADKITATFDEIISSSTELQESFNELKNKSSSSFITASDINQHNSFAQALKNAGISAKSAAEHINSLTTLEPGKLLSAKEVIVDYIGQITEIQELEAKMANDTSLSYTEKEEVISKFSNVYPDLINKIYRTSKGWKIEQTALKSLSDTIKEVAVQQMKYQIKMTEAAIEQTNKRIKTYDIENTALTAKNNLAINLFRNQADKMTGMPSYFSSSSINMDNVLSGRLAEQKAELAKLQEELNDVSVGSILGGGSSSKSSTGSGADKHLEAFNAEYATLKHLREMDLISTEEYFTRLAALNNKYFKDSQKYLDQYRQYEEEVYKGGETIYSERLANSQRYIDNRNTYNDWGADNEIAAWERVKKWTEQYYKDGIISHKEYIEQMDNINKNIHTAKLAQFQKEQTALEELYDMTRQMILQENQDRIDALEDETSHYEDLIAARKKELQLIREKEQYNRTLASKQKDIQKINEDIAEIANDDSASANAKRYELFEQLQKAKLDLDDTVKEHQYQSNIDALDDELSAFKKNQDKKKKELEDFSKDASQIVQATMDRINNRSDGLYQDLCNWNSKYGTGIETDVINKWNAATTALEKYQQKLNTTDFGIIKDYVTDGANNSSNSSSGGSNSGGSSDRIPNVYKINKDGTCPSSAQEKDYLVTGGGVVQIINGEGEIVTDFDDIYKTTQNYDDLDNYLYQIKKIVAQRGYKEGGLIDFTGLTTVHGSPNSPEVAFNATDAKKLFELIHGNSSNDLLSRMISNSLSKTNLSNLASPTIPPSINIQMPINVAGNLDKTVIPDLNKIADVVVTQINTNMVKHGYGRNSTKLF